jgi:rhomboid protease GluP
LPICPQCGSEFAEGGACPECETAHHPAARRAEAVSDSGFPLTKWIIGLNVAVFVAMVLNHVSPTAPTSEQLLRWGANSGPATLSGQWWRLVSNTFEHIGVVHLALNMWCLWNVGALAERLYGRWIFLFIYLFSGIAGSVASLAWHPTVVGAGASGAIFGIAGALIVTFKWGNLPIPRETVRPILQSLMVFAFYNLFYGAVKPGIDNAAHLGGLAGGVVVAAVLIPPALRGAGSERLRLYAAVVLCSLLMGMAALVARTNNWVVHWERAQAAQQKNDTDGYIAELKQVAASKANSSAIQLLLGKAYLAKKQLVAAQARLLRAVELDPKSSDAWTALGALYLQENRLPEAADAFTRALALAPKSAQAHIDMGIVFASQQKPKEAIAEFKRAVELQPGFAPAYYDLGIVYLQTRDFDNALATFQQVARLVPNSVEAQLGVAAAYKGKGMGKEANEAMQKAAKLNDAARPKAAQPPPLTQPK